MFAIRLVNHNRRVIQRIPGNYATIGEATTAALRAAMIEKGLFWHRGIKANLRNTNTGYKIRHMEVQIIQI